MCLDGTWTMPILFYFIWPGLHARSFSLAYHTEHCNWWPVRSWKKATVNILEHLSPRSWWILSARVCIVDCTCPKTHKFNWVSKAETLDLKPWQTRTCEVLWIWSHSSLRVDVWSFVICWKKLHSQLPSPPRRIDKNQPFALQRLTSI